VPPSHFPSNLRSLSPCRGIIRKGDVLAFLPFFFSPPVYKFALRSELGKLPPKSPLLVTGTDRDGGEPFSPFFFPSFFSSLIGPTCWTTAASLLFPSGLTTRCWPQLETFWRLAFFLLFFFPFLPHLGVSGALGRTICQREHERTTPLYQDCLFPPSFRRSRPST